MKDFIAYEKFCPAQYSAEVSQRWGSTDAYHVSKQRLKRYSKQDIQQYCTLQQELDMEMVAIMRQGCLPCSEEALQVVEKMRLLIDEWFYPCTREMHVKLGELYVSDQRFSSFYEQKHSGLAAFVQGAIDANHKYK